MAAGAPPIAIPAGYTARWLSDPEDRSAIERWCADSPDACVYNAPCYIDFARRQNGRGDLLWLVREGQPVLGLPLHPLDSSRVTTGYSGLLLPAGGGALRRGVTALKALLAANARVGFEVLQSAQCPAYEDHARMSELACLLDEQALSGPALYTRMLALEAPESGGGREPGGAPEPGRGPEPGVVPEPDLSGERLLEHGLAPYQAELRNQIRQAVRHDVRAECLLPSSASEVESAYRAFLPLHRESWARTGMAAHSDNYWAELAGAILAGGGRNMVVYARDAAGATLAAVICHLRDGRALYWAGASAERGLQLRANPLCLHAAIQACAQLGVREFELGRFDARERSEKERSVTRYKAQFGGRLLRLVGFHTDPPLTTRIVRWGMALFTRQP